MDIFEKIIAGSREYADYDVSWSECIERYCEDNNIPQEIGDQAYHIYLRREAISHGIPASVVDGKTKLTDHFSQEYINEQCGRTKLPK